MQAHTPLFTLQSAPQALQPSHFGGDGVGTGAWHAMRGSSFACNRLLGSPSIPALLAFPCRARGQLGSPLPLWGTPSAAPCSRTAALKSDVLESPRLLAGESCASGLARGPIEDLRVVRPSAPGTSSSPPLSASHASQPSPVEQILDKEEFTLEELLDEDDIIQECKSLNSRLVAL